MTSTNFLCLLLNLVVYWKNFIVATSTSSDVAIVILSQANSYHNSSAHFLRHSIYEQAAVLNVSRPPVLLSHEQWPDMVGSWTVLPVIPLIVEEFGETKSAILFCEDDVTINLSRLLKKLEKINFRKELFLGRALRDREATIIHHFAFHEDPSSFLYPDFAAGFIISTPLMKRLAERMQRIPFSIDFTIDPQHELALYIWDKGTGVRLTETKYLCGYTERLGDCAVQRLRKSPDCGSSVIDDEIFFAVKTCQKFHKDRVPVLKKTWGRNAKRIEYFSDVEDASIPTTTLGIPNTERGHCAKFMALLRYVYDRLPVTNYKWIVVVDDDTLMSVSRLKKLLSCYNPLETVVLGERYGYGVVKDVGYDYITLGGGMALSQTALRELIDSDTCHCGSDDSPDDMTFGMCLRRLDIKVTHSPLFHQARPVDYAEGYLSNQEPVSFHRHWMIDPLQIYRQWLDDPSAKIESSGGSKSTRDHPYKDQLEHKEL